MNEKELRAQLAALENQNASFKKQKAMCDKIAALEAENAALGAHLASDADAGETADTQILPAVDVAGAESPTQVMVVRKGSRVRSILVGVLLVLSCLTVAVTGVAWWAHYTLLNTDGYMKVVGPVGKDPEVIRALSDYVAGQVVIATDLQQRTAEALPPKAQFLAGPITGAVNGFIADGTDKVLFTPQAYDLWLEINRVAHEKIVALLRGEATYAYIQGDDVKLDTLPLISQVLVWVDGKLPDALGAEFSPPVIAPGTPPDEATQQISSWIGRPLPADFGQVTLLQNDSLGAAQTAVRWFDALVWVVFVVAIVLIALTVWLSRHRRRTLIELGIGLAVALLLARVIVKQASTAIVADVQGGGGLAAAQDAVNASLGPLTNLTVWVAVIGVIVAVVTWISGRHDLQIAVVKAGKSVVQETQDDAFVPDSPLTSWVENYAQWLRIAGLVAGLVVLLVATSSWLSIAVWVLVVVVYEGAISLIIREWPFGRRQQGGGASVE